MTDDLLQLEDIGRAFFSQDERAVVYERIGPYQSSPNASAGLEFGRRGQAHIFIRSLGSAESRPLFEQSPDTGYWIASVSPTRSHLVAGRLRNGELGAVVVSLQSSYARELPIGLSSASPVVWISGDEFIVADERPNLAVPGTLHRIATKVSNLWRETFGGLQPSVTTLESSPGGATQPPQGSGQLVRINAQSGETSQLDVGVFRRISVSPDGHWLAAERFDGRRQPLPGDASQDEEVAHSQDALILINLETQFRGRRRRDTGGGSKVGEMVGNRSNHR